MSKDRMESIEIVNQLRLHRQTIDREGENAWEWVEFLIQRLETAETTASAARNIIAADLNGDFSLEELQEQYRMEGEARAQTRIDAAMAVMQGVGEDSQRRIEEFQRRTSDVIKGGDDGKVG